MAAPQTLKRSRRAERDREVVQRTAELLTSQLSLEDLFHGICELLARFIDGPTIFIALRDGEGARYAFMLENEMVGSLGNRRVPPGSCADRVLSTGTSLLKRTLADWTEGRYSISLAGQNEEITSVSAMFVPLKFGSDVIGVLSVQTEREHAYDESDLSLLSTCALYLSVRIHQAQLESKSARLADMASTDSLTGVRNRRSFTQALSAEWRRAKRRGEPVCAILADIDFFKTFNDTYGHVAGDAALQQVAQALAGCLTRAEDVFARYGGEEFVALLPGTPLAGALTVAERMREAVAALGIVHTGSALGNVTISIGVSSVVPANGIEPEWLLTNADAALYDAKANGRNRVAAENYRSQSPAAVAVRLQASTLPALRGPYFGDEADLDLTCGLLRTARFVTVIGAAGYGKSRHALQVAARISSRYPDGLFYIDCATIGEDRYLSKKIAEAIGIAETPMVTADSALALFLQTKQALIVLDNCDGMSGRVAEYVSAMLAQSRHVRILATCATPLDVPSEVTVRVRPLSPARSLEMMRERAGSGSSGVTLAGGERPQLQALCSRLQGAPRAIELVAAQLRRWSPSELLRDLPDAGAFLAWIYGMLSAEEQRALRRLSVFVGGAPADAAQNACGDPETLAGLCEKALLIRDRTSAGDRYFVPSAIRDFAVRQAVEVNDWDDCCMEHARYFVARAESIAWETNLLQAQRLCGALINELDNLRAALSFLIGDAADLLLGARLMDGLLLYWNATGQQREGLEWAEALVAYDDGRFSKPVRARILHCYAGLDAARRQTGYERALQAAQLYRELGNDRRASLALCEAIFACAALGRMDETHGIFVEAYAIAERIGDLRCMAQALSGAGLAEHYRFNTERANEYLQRSLELFRELGYDRGVAYQLGNLGDVAATCGDYDRAVELTRQALAIHERLSDKVATSWLLTNLGLFECKRGNLDAARPALRRGLELAQDCQHAWLVPCALDYLARIALAEKEWTAALHLAGYADAMLAGLGLPRQPSDRADYETLVKRAVAELGAERTERELEAGRSATRALILLEALQV